MWGTLLKLSRGPGTLISSKNNNYLKVGDPVLKILGVFKESHQGLCKTTLDDFIGPTDRLVYSA